MIRGGNDLQRFRRERRVHATRPRGLGHARLEFSEKVVHRGTRYRLPTRVTKMRGAVRCFRVWCGASAAGPIDAMTSSHRLQGPAPAAMCWLGSEVVRRSGSRTFS